MSMYVYVCAHVYEGEPTCAHGQRPEQGHQMHSFVTLHSFLFEARSLQLVESQQAPATLLGAGVTGIYEHIILPVNTL